MSYNRMGELDRVYEWEGGTLVLNPGEFTFDEPHVYMGNDPPGYARATSCMYRPDLQSQSCPSPQKLLAMDHGSAPISVLNKCDTISPDEGYCCPPYAMPRNWRMDFLPMGMGQEDNVADITGFDATFVEDAQLYEADARIAAGKLMAGTEAGVEEFSADAQDVYNYLVKYGNIAATDVGTATTTAAIQVAKATAPAIQTTQVGIQKHPFLAVGLGIVAGALVARWISRRR